MYTSYFGFREKPFNVTPDPRFFYTNPVYQEAYATLFYGIRERKGLIVLTGEVGSGKTTLLRKLMDDSRQLSTTFFFYNTNPTFEEILTSICNELAPTVEGRGRLAKIRLLNDFLIGRLERGATAALLIDEAQNLSNDVLENLRLLSNLETGHEKLLQIVLAGQPELESLLDHGKLRQLKQRITLRYRLDRLNEREVGSYIDYRLRAAGYESNDLFSPDGLKLIFIYSKGIPRLINVICDNALLITYAFSRKKVSGDVIREVARDLQLESNARATKMSGRQTQSDEPLKPALGHLTSVALWTAMLLFFLSAGGAIIYPRQTKNYLSTVNSKFEELVANARDNIELINRSLNLWLTDLMPEEAKLENVQTPVRSESLAGSGTESGKESSSAVDAEPQVLSEETDPSASPVVYEREESEEQKSPSTPDPAAPVERKIENTRILEGSAIGSIAYHFYGANSLLGMDLIKEFNPQLQDLNWISFDWGLRIPSLTKETLQREQPDGSYHLILAAFPSLIGGQRFAQAIRLKGYEVVITRREVAENLSLHRVEIAGLKTLEAANHAWEAALANRWVSFADTFSEKSKNEQNPRRFEVR
jgi:type II secretory pathway predicted ATPase ExeA